MWRLVLAVLFAFVSGWLVHPQLAPDAGTWWVVLPVAAYTLIAPFVVKVPLPVPAQRVEM